MIFIIFFLIKNYKSQLKIVFQVETPFNKSITIGPVPLPPKDHVVKTNDVAVVSGWGSSGVSLSPF